MSYSKMIVFKVSYGSMGFVTENRHEKCLIRTVPVETPCLNVKLLPSYQFVSVFYVVKNYRVYTVIKFNARAN